MRNNSGQPPTPSGLFSARLRLSSVNSPFISPLRIVPSPYINDPGFYDSLNNQADLNHFQLEDNPIDERQLEENSENPARDSQSEAEPAVQDSPDPLTIDQGNVLEFVLTHVNRHEDKLTQARRELDRYGSEFLRKLFDYLVGKFAKLKKTKEEMVKYCVRKSFKHITNKMRAANREAYINLENNEVVAEYFELNCQGDLSISMPFKKNSEEKTMNSLFLNKIFKCRQYNVDYREFLKYFPSEYNADNRKKVKSMNEAIKKCAKAKCLKGLDEYKRLPWTAQILQKIFEFAKKLTEHSPYKKQQIDMKAMENSQQVFKIQRFNQEENSGQDDARLKVPQKKSVIILTPPARPMDDPEGLSDQKFLE